MDLVVALSGSLLTHVVDEAAILTLQLLELMQHRLLVRFVRRQNVAYRGLSVSDEVAHLRIQPIWRIEIFHVVDFDHLRETAGLEVSVEQKVGSLIVQVLLMDLER